MYFILLAMALMATLVSASPYHVRGLNPLPHPKQNTTTSILNPPPTATGQIAPRSHVPTGQVFPRKFFNTTTAIFNPLPTATGQIAPRSHVPTGQVFPRKFSNTTTAIFNPLPTATGQTVPREATPNFFGYNRGVPVTDLNSLPVGTGPIAPRDHEKDITPTGASSIVDGLTLHRPLGYPHAPYRPIGDQPSPIPTVAPSGHLCYKVRGERRCLPPLT
ncbi:MAG: hypothetical protein Q9171_006263 [Xanthocarpia ochracea]